MASAYSDTDCGSSRLPRSIQHAKPRNAHYQRRHVKQSIYAPLLLLLLALSTAQALFDPGDSTVATPLVKKEAASTVAGRKIEEHKIDKDADSSLSLITPKGQPISLHPGCRRTTDLFDNVCQNPWSPILGGSKKSPASRSELVICPLGEVDSGGTKERIFAVTGTVTLPESISDQVQVSASSIESYRQQSNALEGKEAHWPKPGDEGFWRQRDGELEWVPNEARALLESDTTPASTIKEPSESLDKAGDKVSTEAQAKEYNAWSESIGGEDAETWLSFDQWREKHLELEKQKNAANRKQKAEKAKEKEKEKEKEKKAGQVQAQVHDGAANTNATAVVSNAEATSSVQPDKRGVTPKDSSAPSIAPSIEQIAVSSSTPETATTASDGQPQTTPSGDAEIEQPAAVKADTSQDTGSIPAVGDASSRLTELKHRWNFASFDCAAVVHRSNPSAKFTSAILSEKKDRYMLSPCPEQGGEEQFVVVELCDEISVDTIVLANYEFFSRMFKKFRVRVSRNLNGGEGEWYDIGSFRARNVRGLQIFNTLPPKADSRFFRYVRIDFLEHYGSEFYCPVSLLRVYGLTQMDDYIREEEEMKKQREAELTLSDSEMTEDEEEEVKVSESASGVEAVNVAQRTDAPSESTSDVKEADPTSIAAATSSTPAPSATKKSSAILNETKAEVAVPLASQSSSTIQIPHNGSKTSSVVASTVISERPLPTGSEFESGKPMIDLGGHLLNNTVSFENVTASNVNTNHSTPQIPKDVMPSVTYAEKNTTTATNTTASLPASIIASNATANATVEEMKERAVNASSSASLPSSSNPQESNKPIGANQQQHSGGSESIYRTITKRLNMLETNATLSSQYMEHSRQQLREVFNRMERNQRDKIADMLRELNSSNWRQIESLKRRQQLDLQQAIFEFDKHRQQTDAERRALLAQMHILSNEVILEKRFGVAQLVLLLSLFVFMVFTRGSRAVPLIHEGIARISKTPPRSGTAEDVSNLAQQSRKRELAPLAHDQRGTSREGIRHRARAYTSTPRTDRLMRLTDRPVRLRGSSINRYSSDRRHSVSQLPTPMQGKVVVPEVIVSKARHPSLSPEKFNNVLLPSRNGNVSPSSKITPKNGAIKVEIANIGSPIDDLETPISRLPPLKATKFDREDTPTNSSALKLYEENGKEPLSSLPTDDSFGGGSDWGTERSDNEDDSQALIDSQDEDRKPSLVLLKESTTPSPLIISPPIPSRQIFESDAEEDSPYHWNPVKSRRSLKRSGSNGTNYPNGRHHNNQSRGHTPTNNGTHNGHEEVPLKRTFSPFNKQHS